MANSPDKLPHVQLSSEWVTYYEQNARELREIPWETGAGTSDEELATISASLRGWQLGETSDGSHLLAAAKHYAITINDPEFIDAVRLFIAEEQRHGGDLGKFLDLAGIKRAESDWGDTLFRKIRYAFPRMEVWATPVVMVETHAMVYYNALRRATKSPVLRRICEQILADEVAHIRFQCERLAILHRRRSKLLLQLTMVFHRIAFTAITIAVWVGHRKVLRAGGYNFHRFWRAVWGKMRFAWRLMSPDRYQWDRQSIGQHSISTAALTKFRPSHKQID
ncbi:MAG: ferritin-like domain-containing protein [Zavarzinella sp.]